MQVAPLSCVIYNNNSRTTRRLNSIFRMNTLISPSISVAFPTENNLLAAERCGAAWGAIVALLGPDTPDISADERAPICDALLKTLCDWRMVRLTPRPASSAPPCWETPHFIVECGIRMVVMDIVSKYELVPRVAGFEHALLHSEVDAIFGTFSPHDSFEACAEYVSESITTFWGESRPDVLSKLAFHTMIDMSHESGASAQVDRSFLEMAGRTSGVLAAREMVRWAVRAATDEPCEAEDSEHESLLAWFRKRAAQQHSEEVRTGMRERLIATELSPLHAETEEPASKVAARTNPAHAQAIIDRFSKPFGEFIENGCTGPPADAVLLGMFDYYMRQLFAIDWAKHYTCNDRCPVFAHRRLEAYAVDRMRAPPPIMLLLDGSSYVIERGPVVGALERCTRHESFSRALLKWVRIVSVERKGKLTLGKNIGRFIDGMIHPGTAPVETGTVGVGVIEI